MKTYMVGGAVRDRLLGLPFWMAAIGLAAILVVVLYALESLQSWRNETGTDHDGLMAPPAVSGGNAMEQKLAVERGR